MREDLIQSAVNFLKDPKVQSASMAKKTAFLESKGMTSAEIQEAIRRVSGGESTTTAVATTTPMAAPTMPAQYGPVMMQAPPPPPPPSLTWKDYFIAAVMLGGVGYGAAMLAKRYFGSTFSWPSRQELDEDKKRLDEEFEKTKKALEEMVKETNEANLRVEASAQATEELLKKTQEALDELSKRDEEHTKKLEQVSAELDRVREALPRILQQSKDAQTVALNDLQAEIKSLKGLLSTRSRVDVSNTDGSASTADSPGLNVLSSLGIGSASTAGRPTIPAWQLASQPHNAKKPEASPNTEAASNNS
jgi:peroxin-14